jgi:Spy/CpxP family protein refolding chaperone
LLDGFHRERSGTRWGFQVKSSRFNAQGKETEMTIETTRQQSPARPRSRRGWTALLLALPLLLGGVTYSVAEAHGFGGRGAMHEQMEARMQRILTDVGASDAQKAQIKAIWDGLRPQLKAAHQDHFRLRGQIAQAIAAPSIDTAAIEKLRQQSVQQMDKSSALITQGMVQTAQVLTPDQRQKALAEMHRHHQEEQE